MNEIKKILLIENEDNVAKAIRVGLEKSLRYKFQVSCAKDCSEYEAKGLFRQRFDLAVLDLLLTREKPSFSGLRGIILSMQIEHPGVPVVIFSGYPTIQNIVSAMQIGATNFISKEEVAPDQLVEEIEQYFDNQKSWQARQQGLDKLVAQQWSTWQRDYPGQFLVIVGREVVVVAPNRVAACIEYDRQLDAHPDWPEAPDMIEIIMGENVK